jgi:hypothetical protein
MRVALHILTKPDDTLARTVLDQLRERQDQVINVIDLTVAEPDYARLIQEIFAADSVAVW